MDWAISPTPTIKNALHSRIAVTAEALSRHETSTAHTDTNMKKQPVAILTLARPWKSPTTHRPQKQAMAIEGSLAAPLTAPHSKPTMPYIKRAIARPSNILRKEQFMMKHPLLDDSERRTIASQ
jgi:hypothetical protein